MRMIVLAPATAIALALYIAAPSAASDATDVMTTVKEYLGDFNKGDADQAAGLCAPQAIIVDDFPPHTWQGPTACLDWWNALVAFDKSKGITDEDVTIGKPRRVVVTGDRAYVVVPATYKYKENGKPVTDLVRSGHWLCKSLLVAGASRDGLGHSDVDGVSTRCA